MFLLKLLVFGEEGECGFGGEEFELGGVIGDGNGYSLWLGDEDGEMEVLFE